MSQPDRSAPDQTPWTLRVRPTPPPTQRLVDHALWDESVRPRGPRAPTGTAFAPGGEMVAGHLVEIHDMLRGELERVRAVVAQVAAGETTIGAARSAINEMTLSQQQWAVGAYCANYCRMISGHHGLEDAAVFPHLRGSDPALAPVVDRLAAEHLVIHGVVESVDRALVSYHDGSVGLDAVRRAVDLLTDTLLSHLSYEEHELLEPLARHGFFPGQV